MGHVLLFSAWLPFDCRTVTSLSYSITISFRFRHLALHCIALYCIALHCIALYCIALHCIALHCIALPCIALYCLALPCLALHCIALHCIALHCIALPCLALHCLALHCIALHCLALHGTSSVSMYALTVPYCLSGGLLPLRERGLLSSLLWRRCRQTYLSSG
jgi:hypothetical protein